MECMHPAQGDRRKVAEGIKYPFGITSFGKNIYYTDWQRFDLLFLSLRSAFLFNEWVEICLCWCNLYGWNLWHQRHILGFIPCKKLNLSKEEEGKGRSQVKKHPTFEAWALDVPPDLDTLRTVGLSSHAADSVCYRRGMGCLYLCVWVCGSISKKWQLLAIFQPLCLVSDLVRASLWSCQGWSLARKAWEVVV